VFSSLSLYYMSFFLMPKKVARVITSIKRRFLWCGDAKDQTIYKVAWQMVVKGKNRRGLGISSLEGKYKALLLKWLWRLCDNNSGGWQELINKKYQVSFTNGLPILHPPLSETWQSINSLIDTNSAIRDALKNNCWYRVDNDKHIHAYFLVHSTFIMLAKYEGVHLSSVVVDAILENTYIYDHYKRNNYRVWLNC